jgi:exosortase C (VPDSG-CTERM-specific)
MGAHAESCHGKNAMTDQTTPAAASTAPFRNFALAAAALALAFGVPLLHLLRFAVGDDLHSHILLMPFVCVYFARLKKNELPGDSAPAKKTAGFFFIAGGAVLAWHWWSGRAGTPLVAEDDLVLTTLAFVLFLTGLGGIFLGGAKLRALAFPFALLVFLVPLPVFLREGIETFLQHGSALVADAMFRATGMTVFRDGMIFRLPGMTLEVAPECSGIHSTLVLFITSLLAGQMFLRRAWGRVALCAVVLPLALARNGLRIFVIGELCVHVGPQMIDSPIHHHGGPLFFVVSLVPFFLLLYFLKRTESLNNSVPAASIN